MAYNKKIIYGDIMTVGEFIEDCKLGCLRDEDGFGHPVKDNREDRDISIWPSELQDIPQDATHIVWFNK